MTDWGNIIRGIMKEERVTQRRLEGASGVSRSSLKRLLKNEGDLGANSLESLLAALGYSLKIEKTGEASPMARKPRRLNTTSHGNVRKPIRARGVEGFI